MLGITFSRRLAVAGGLVLPVLETARRWNEWPGPVNAWLPWFDDYLLGAILLVAAWLSKQRASDGQAPQSRHFPDAGGCETARSAPCNTSSGAYACNASYSSKTSDRTRAETDVLSSSPAEQLRTKAVGR
jgi:hypothetical protein